MTKRKREHTIIALSSSSSSEDEEECEGEEDDVDDDERVSGDSSDYCEDDEENESDDFDEENDDDIDDNDGTNEEVLCKRVVCLLKEGKDLAALSLKECKAYLRKHGLRLAGTKMVCIQRIKEHWRIKDGNGELLYPRSSFVMNCTGDVCNGDVVLFTQKVYERFDKVTRQGNLLGKRTVAGRVVKESYGSAKQQHTFTVEVLWSKGIKKLPPLFPLLVKGRNLYKLKTFRQRWNDEVERIEVLAEKHRRGRAARLVRAMKKSKKKLSAIGFLNGGVKHQKCSYNARPSQTRKTAEPGKQKCVYHHKKDTLQQYAKANNHHREVPQSRQLNLNRNNVDSEATCWHLKSGRLNADMDPMPHSHAYIHQNPCSSHIEFHYQNVPYRFSGYDMSSSSTMMKLPPLRRYTDTVVMPALQHQRINHRNDTIHDYSNPSYNFGSRNLNHF
ncbi:hypothetical protein JCGZ_12361 [Jatropha curcas]|uniref:SAP domain-containing protein n=1 Tax=Jatropha curcas TaxID=180498 RepID=A0A067KI05_JATCU|nr:zinc finger CCCH domain-containing protein 62 [Jatropha curcas]XP_037491647.1 zinc finger CCCH domain-containing protein 62 [Jatropha curcas]KDP31900.1 hypothetical protein JCGZ_12361 [Jatropha curcas]